MEPKRTILSVDVSPELKAHLVNTADQKGVDLSKYIKAVLKKASGFKDKKIV